MKIKNITKIITTLIIVITILLSFMTIVQATINPDDFRPSDLTDSDTETAFERAGTIVTTIINIGLVISIVAFMILGIKYMIGSVEEKAEYKKTLVPMVVGTLMIFAIGKIVSIIWSVMASVNGNV